MMMGKDKLKYCVILPIVLAVTIFLWCCPSSFFGSLGEMLTVSSKSISFCMKTGDDSVFVPYTEILRFFADPVVMLFLGGFVLAIVASKYGMDVTMARILLKPFGKKPKTVLLGVLLVISVFSMFMSNTAAAAMFLAFLAPVFSSLPDTDAKGKAGIALAIPLAANIGGIGTPIGTPPNAIAVSTGLVETKDMTRMGLIIGIVGLVLGFLWVTKFFPFSN